MRIEIELEATGYEKWFQLDDTDLSTNVISFQCYQINSVDKDFSRLRINQLKQAQY